MHALLHGEDIVSPKHARSSISHQHELAPDDRTKQKSAAVVRQLLVRAAQRLRDDGFFCRRLAVEVKWLGRDQDVWIGKRTFYETQDTGVLLDILQEVWDEVPDLKPLRVCVVLSRLALEQAHQPDLFNKPTDTRLVAAVDELNAKFGKGAITYGAVRSGQTSKNRLPACTESEGILKTREDIEASPLKRGWFDHNGGTAWHSIGQSFGRACGTLVSASS